MDSLLDRKKRFEADCEQYVVKGLFREAAKSAARSAEVSFSLAERTKGRIAEAHLKAGEGWIQIADTLSERAARTGSGRKSGGLKTGDCREPGEDGESDENDWLVAGVPGIRFDDIVGMDALKSRIRRYMLKVQNPDEVSRWPGARSGDGMILYGPPGTGKTFFAKAVATELDAAFFDVKGSNLLSKWVGESQKNVARLFEAMSGFERAVLYMDEVDGLLASRGTGSSSVREGVLTEFLQSMDGVRSNMRSLLFIGATNRAVSIDRAILSRVGAMIYVPLPDQAARRALLQRVFDTLPDGIGDDLELDELAARFEGCSMRDITRFSDLLVDVGICRKVECGNGCIGAKEVIQAWNEASPMPMSERELQKYERLAQ